MLYANIFKIGNGWQLIVSDTPNIQGAKTEGYYATKAIAKHRAATLGAKPWNY
ncbi:hypothetical protein [Polynucleobacter sp. UK-Kesae-W10]|uniref:hypothetical protein n=1 Tax=Polynucleobacter sp. UK-Kesae-W10 TaxID=1819738 RepID=UPI001C0D361C|nr:hypothetical protein [Polynucleobacter sp. UK-Kesae-W10]MBU3577558.1 hypothetical protein [Polynucleobacter sp. UK-Kesae-W10]